MFSSLGCKYETVIGKIIQLPFKTWTGLHIPQLNQLQLNSDSNLLETYMKLIYTSGLIET